MSESSLLETTAEVAVAFAGFIGIILVLIARENGFPARDALQAKMIVVTSVATVFYSAAPPVLSSFGLSGITLWRLASRMAGVVGVSIAAWLVPQQRQLPLAERTLTSPNSLATWTLGGLASLLCLINTLAWPGASSGAVYLLAVWFAIGTVGLNFVSLVIRRLV